MTYRRNVAQKRVANQWTAIAPVGGLNDRDPLAATPPQFCIELENWYPGNNALQARSGYREWVTNIGEPVQSMLSYIDMSGTQKIFAVTNEDIFDVTISTDAPVSVQEVTNGDYKSVIFGNVATQWLVAVNGRGSPALLFDGTTWTEMLQTTPSPLAIGEVEGVDPTLFSQVAVFKRRLWFVQSDSMTAWYFDIDAVGGVATPFYLTGVFKRGGKLSYIIDWSVDAGDGLNNKLVFVSTTGEMAVYSGDDPDDALTWVLEAVLYVAAPMGERTYADAGGDIMFLTTFGVLQMSNILSGQAEITPLETSLSTNINRTLNRISTSGLYARNWQIFNLANAQALMVNIPTNGGNPSIQFVMNMLTGAWCRFTLPIKCAGFLGGKMYFGTDDGRVCLYGEGIYLDNVARDGSGGEQIICKLFTAFSYMENPSNLKHWKLLRPMFQANSPPNYVLRINTDFSLFPLSEVPAPPQGGTVESLWDEALWDQATWSQADLVYRPWVGVGGVGYSVAVLLNVGITARTDLVAIDYVYEDGALI